MFSLTSMAVHHILFCCVLIFSCLNERCFCEARGARGRVNGYRLFSPSNFDQELLQDEEESRVRTLSFAGDEVGNGFKVDVKELGAGSFGVTVGLGTPKQDFNLFLDPGSDITWIKQCQSCSQSNCNNSQTSIFDTSASSTFSNPCSNNSSSSNCKYSIRYNDGSYSDGSWVHDTLTFTSSIVYPNFVFGCSLNSGGDFDGADGLLGVGPGSDSLTSQASKFGLFCYCLPTSKSSTGYIMFGLFAVKTCNLDIENFMPLLRNPNGAPHYFVNLVGITIGQKRLDVEAYMSSSLLGVIVDSGTTISRLPESVHEALKSEFRGLMSGYTQAPKLSELLDTCYDLTGHNNVSIPNMVLHFEGSKDVQLDPSAVLWKERESQACLAFAGNKHGSGLNIIGGHQQRSLAVYYDLPNMKLAFGTGGC